MGKVWSCLNSVQANEDLSKALSGMKITLYGDQEHEPNQDNIGALANDIYSSDLIPVLLSHLAKYDFEVILSIFISLISKGKEGCCIYIQ